MRERLVGEKWKPRALAWEMLGDVAGSLDGIREDQPRRGCSRPQRDSPGEGEEEAGERVT